MSGSSHTAKRLKVAGGFYAEVCHFPSYSEHYGSGGRAAAAIPKEGVEVQLCTFADEPGRAALLGLAEAVGFTTEISAIDSLYRFEYLHLLSPPLVYRPRELPSAPLQINGDIVLCFGMMEGQPKVKGGTVVFDPQSHHHASAFSANGSEAEKLAIIANHAEAKTLTGESDERLAAEKLLQADGASVAVVKCGPRGAWIATPSGVSRVPAFQTERVFKIGSGDVFSAVFAYAWAVREWAPEPAARAASLATAYFCQYGKLPVPWPLPPTFSPAEVKVSEKPRKAYLAGPFFSPAQLWMIEECRRHLAAAGIEVFSPFHQVGPGGPAKVVGPDLRGLDEADFVLAVVDGFDAGTLFEIGYAVHQKDKPVIALYHGEDDNNLTMLVGTNCRICRDIASAIYAAASA